MILRDRVLRQLLQLVAFQVLRPQKLRQMQKKMEASLLTASSSLKVHQLQVRDNQL